MKALLTIAVVLGVAKIKPIGLSSGVPNKIDAGNAGDTSSAAPNGVMSSSFAVKNSESG